MSLPDSPGDNDNAVPVLASLKRISGVLGVVQTAPDGVILGADLPDRDGASEAVVTLFWGVAADQIGELLDLGPFERGVGTIGSRCMLVLKHEETYVGLALKDQASPVLVGNAAINILRS